MRAQTVPGVSIRTTWMPIVAVLGGVAMAHADPPPTTTRPPQSAQSLPRPEGLPEGARLLLHERMSEHGGEMRNLVMAVVLLDWENARRLADAVASGPRLARPLTGDASELNSALPERFFTLHEQMRDHARKLSAAATKHEPIALGAQYALLSKTCVACHAAYLEARPKAK